MACFCGRCNRNNSLGNNGLRGPVPAGAFGPGGPVNNPYRRGRGQIRCGTDNDGARAAAEAAALAAQEAALAQGQDPGAPRFACDSPAAQMYGARDSAAPVLVRCCDACGGCRLCRLEDRNRFWPTFAHPRWLSCEQLYRQRQGR